MNRLIAVVAMGAAMTLAGTALANDTLEATFGNAVTVSTADGTVVATYFMNANNTYEMETAEGRTGGMWNTNDAGEVCLTPTEGEGGCNALPEGVSVGESWTVEDGENGTLTIAIVAQ